MGQEEYKLNGEGEWEGGVHISKAPPFRIGKEKYHQPSDGHEGEGDMGNAMVQDVDGLNDSIITYKDAVIDFGYEPIYNINGVNKNTVGIHTDTGLHNFRRNAVRRMLETNSMNIVISGRTNINAGMVINLDLRQPIPGRRWSRTRNNTEWRDVNHWINLSSNKRRTSMSVNMCK